MIEKITLYLDVDGKFKSINDNEINSLEDATFCLLPFFYPDMDKGLMRVRRDTLVTNNSLNNDPSVNIL